MRNNFDDFQKMKIKEACKTISDMTYTYIDPNTKLPTEVPAKHYEGILSKTVEQALDESIKMQMLNNVYKQLVFLQQEYGKDFIKSLLCLDCGIKPLDMTVVQTIALEETYVFVENQKNEQKRNFHFLDQLFINKYTEVFADKEYHARLLGQSDEVQEEEQEQDDLTELN